MIDDFYWKVYLLSFKIVVILIFLVLLIGFFMVYGMVKVCEDWWLILMMLVILLFWISFLICVYVWVGIFSMEGYLN